tara:strand:+ start:624 stop:1256 length:633 start_codon:yes stop_codon:yes gene_type:complete
MQQKFQGLKKEFNRKDVERVRNLVKGNADVSSETQIGYKKKQVEYKEGDVWTENRKTWTIKNGIKQTMSKLDAIKKEVFMPLCCPECSKVMKKMLDKPNYKIHKKCFDCVSIFEHNLIVKRQKESGEDYTTELKKHLEILKTKNSLAIIDDIESQLLDIVNSSNSNYVSEQGDIERWVGGIDKGKMTKEIKQGAQKTRKKFKKDLKTYND